MKCEWVTLEPGIRGVKGSGSFVECPRRATYRVKDDRTTMTRLCARHTALVNRRLRAAGDTVLVTEKETA